MDLYDYPSTDTFLESSSIVRYTEDIYVGYRYFETFAPDKVAYEFGFGLSYTTFDITTDSVANDGENITVKATVKNTGDVAGKEVVEVYYSAPQAGEGSAKLSKSAIDLAAYKKTGLIQPGESETVEISYPISDMASFDDTGVSGHLSSYVLEAGTYDILVGSSVKKNVKAGEYTVDELVVTERDTQLCKTNLDERLTADGTYESMGSVTLVTKDEVAIIEGESFNSVYSESGIAPLRETFNANQGWIYNGTTWVKTGAGMILGNLDDGGDLDIGFKINVRDAGTYRMSFVTSNGNANYSTVEDILAVYLLMPDGTRVNSDIHFDIRSTYSARTITGYRWWNFRYETEDFQGNQYTIDLPAGEYEIVLSNNTNNNRANMNFDKFYLIPEGKDYTLQDAIDAYNYKEPQDLGLDLDATNDQGITYLDVVNGDATFDEFVSQMSYNEMIDLCSGHTSGVLTGTGSIGPSSDNVAAKYGIFTADTADGPAGIRLTTYWATYWPCSTLQACTWNTELIEAIGRDVGNEAISSMVDIWLAPGMNIHRSPLCGRNFEYYSEDPLVTGKSAAALTRGVQSEGPSVTLKHFCANNKERNRNSCDSRISEKALREIYLKGFEIAVKEADPHCIMTSYNYLNGTETSENYDLLHGILRNEWGWDGLVMTDWGNNSNIVAELNAGNNVKMSSGDLDLVRSAASNGLITRATLEENTMYILNALAHCPDFSINQYKVHDVAPTGRTIISCTDFARKAYHSRFEKVSALNRMGTNYPQNTDADGHAVFFEWNVHTEQAGDFIMELNYAASGAYNDLFEVSVNGEVVDGLVNDVATTGAWTTYRWMQLGQISLPKGDSVIKFQHISADGTNYMDIALTAIDPVQVIGGTAAYGENARVRVIANQAGITSITGKFVSDLDVASVKSDNGTVVMNEDGTITATNPDGFAAGATIFEGYIAIDKTAADGIENGEVDITFEVDEAYIGGDAMARCDVTPGVITVSTAYALGDVNGDGEISNVDLIMVARHIVHLNTLTAEQIARADMNSNGSIDNVDLIRIARIIVAA